jgi:hypothetical protein
MEAERMGPYNGWRNYETWAVNLWLSNEQGSYEYWRDLAREAWQDAEATDILTREQVARSGLAARLKDEIEEHNPCPDACLYADLLTAALSEVDWYEVAEAFLEGIPDEEEDEQGEG